MLKAYYILVIKIQFYHNKTNINSKLGINTNNSLFTSLQCKNLTTFCKKNTTIPFKKLRHSVIKL